MFRHFKEHLGLFLIFLGIAGFVLYQLLLAPSAPAPMPVSLTEPADSTWTGPTLDIDFELAGEERRLVMYGEDLIAHTARYLGPRGTVAAISNGMNCQNCHLDAGKQAWGNNYGGVYSTYPKYRARSGSITGIYERISGCFQRSLNGAAPDSNSREYRAMYAYMKWLGRQVPRGKKPYGSGIEKLPYLERPADPVKGSGVFAANCQRCHGADGQGEWLTDSSEYRYPPLWGPHSYNNGAGLYRLGSFAGYVRNNMPFQEASRNHPVLSVEDAWDVAAFVNSQPRPQKDQQRDWPDIREKPIDFPYGPYADPFPEKQHKFGPFGPIEAWRKNAAAAGSTKPISAK